MECKCGGKVKRTDKYIQCSACKRRESVEPEGLFDLFVDTDKLQKAVPLVKQFRKDNPEYAVKHEKEVVDAIIDRGLV